MYIKKQHCYLSKICFRQKTIKLLIEIFNKYLHYRMIANNRRSYLILFTYFQVLRVFAQNDTLNKVTFSGYGEVYYSYDFSNPANHEKPNFIYNHKRHNEINTNLILVKANYSDQGLRANLGVMAGNYAQYNLSAEPNWAQFIYEANIGIKLSNKRNLWLDAGILPSHIGFESAIGADCWTPTRSIAAENSPYFETGLKIGYTNRKENLQLAFLILNGWQRIKKPDYIQSPSTGFQLNYRASDKLTLNYSNFIGTDKADSLNSIRTFHNVYLQYLPTSQVSVLLGFDMGSDKYNMKEYGIWYTPVLILRYSINDKSSIAMRGEYYMDKRQVLIATNSINGFQVSGVSANVDHKINRNAIFRIEGKMYSSKDRLFGNAFRANFSMTTTMSVKF